MLQDFHLARTGDISIHPPLAGRDRRGPTSSLTPNRISIHPPLAGRDQLNQKIISNSEYFNPPAPRGTGHVKVVDMASVMEFQSTRPSRDGTMGLVCLLHKLLISIHPPLAGRDDDGFLNIDGVKISIHPPLAGRDIRQGSPLHLHLYFNPPAPRGTGHVLRIVTA